MWSMKTLKSFAMPGAVVLLCTAVLAYSGWLTLPLPALTFLSYCGVLGGMLLAWRFHSSRVFLCLFVLLLAHLAMPALTAGSQPGPAALTVLRALSFLVPLNYVLLSLMEERGLTTSSITPVAVFIFIETVVVSVLWRSAESTPVAVAHLRHPSPIVILPSYSMYILIPAAAVLTAKFLFTKKTVDSALLWSLIAFHLCLRNAASATVSELYLATSAYVLAFSIIENSYLLAYHDELTSLPSRRAYNDATLRLQAPYSLAVVDIDRFKRFNDTYGHDVGDQVLRLVAAKLARVSGGGEAYRCGGEEFTILFPGKKLPEVTEHLEHLRQAIESSEFRMRGQDRRQLTRGPDRRTERAPANRKRKADAIRQLAHSDAPAALSVTVSIGAASSEFEGPNPELVSESADKALYRAKAAGRNRLELASPKRRSKAKTTGTA